MLTRNPSIMIATTKLQTSTLLLVDMSEKRKTKMRRTSQMRMRTMVLWMYMGLLYYLVGTWNKGFFAIRQTRQATFKRRMRTSWMTGLLKAMTRKTAVVNLWRMLMTGKESSQGPNLVQMVKGKTSSSLTLGSLILVRSNSFLS